MKKRAKDEQLGRIGRDIEVDRDIGKERRNRK